MGLTVLRMGLKLLKKMDFLVSLPRRGLGIRCQALSRWQYQVPASGAKPAGTLCWQAVVQLQL
jgi:hypothetical protein